MKKGIEVGDLSEGKKKSLVGELKWRKERSWK